MKDKLITQITTDMAKHLSLKQLENLQKVLMATFINVEIVEIKTVNYLNYLYQPRGLKVVVRSL